MRRVALLLALVMALGAGVATTAAPALAQKGKATKAKKIKSCQKDKDVAQHIQDAFNQYLTSDTSADKMKLVENGDKLIEITEEGARAAAAAGRTQSGTTTYAVDIKVTCNGKKSATFTYDLAINLPKPVTNPPSTGIGLDFAGDAVLIKGQWYITGETICDLIGQNPDTPTLGQKCLDTLAGL